jgi:hypothetical protein
VKEFLEFCWNEKLKKKIVDEKVEFNQGILNEREKISTVDLLVLTSSDQLVFILRLYLSLFTKQLDLKRRSIVQSLPFQ